MTTGLASLALRLTEPHDREAYASLVSFIEALPPGDDLFKLAELLGLLALLGQRLPEALGEFVVELRRQTALSGEHVSWVNERLEALPNEIAAGVDPAAIAREMSEAFRQQIKDAGLLEAASALRNGAREIRAVSQDMAAALRPLTSEYRATAATLTAELAALVAAARLVEEHNKRLIAREQSAVWWRCVPWWLVAAGVGIVVGLWIARRGG